MIHGCYTKKTIKKTQKDALSNCGTSVTAVWQDTEKTVKKPVNVCINTENVYRNSENVSILADNDYTLRRDNRYHVAIELSTVDSFPQVAATRRNLPA